MPAGGREHDNPEPRSDVARQCHRS